jgi:hypothetical protein
MRALGFGGPIFVRFMNAPDPLASLRRLDMPNARRLPKLSTNSRSFEFPFDVTA